MLGRSFNMLRRSWNMLPETCSEHVDIVWLGSSAETDPTPQPQPALKA
jgi:hypothetical protein